MWQCETFLGSIPLPLNEEEVYMKYPTEYTECALLALLQPLWACVLHRHGGY